MEEVIEAPEFNDQLSEMMKQRFPFLRAIDDRNKHYQKLVVLIHEVEKTDPTRVEKYELLYKVVKIGNLVQALLGDSTENLLVSDIGFQELSPLQQAGQFRLSRNLAGHFGHILYEADARSFLRDFVSLCQGKNISQALAPLGDLTKKIKRSRDLVKAINSDERLLKLLAQLIYFLNKSKQLVEISSDGAALAFTLACDCAKDFNLYLCETEMRARRLKSLNSAGLVTLLNTPDVLHVRDLLTLTIALYGARGPLAHCFVEEYQNMDDETRFGYLSATIERAEFQIDRIKKLVEEFFIGKCEERINELFEGSFEMALERILSRKDDESPRSYEKSVLRK